MGLKFVEFEVKIELFADVFEIKWGFRLDFH